MSDRDSLATQQARIAGLARSAKEPSGAAMTERARRTYRDSFNPTDPDLPEAERQRMGLAAYRAHMSQLAKRRHQKARDAAAAAPPAPPAPPAGPLADLPPELVAELVDEFRAILRQLTGELAAGQSADAV